MRKAIVVGLLALSFAVEAQQCYRTTIQEPSPFLGNGGEVIVLADGSIWKDSSYKYLYLYAYYPSVILCPNEGKLIFGGYEFTVARIGALNSAPSQPSSPTPRRRE